MPAASKAPKKNRTVSSKSRDHVSFFLNGQLTSVSGADAFMTLAEWLRKRALLTGTKIVCAEGDCGACTVLRAFDPSPNGKRPAFAAINSCIAFVAQMDGSHLVTIEGVALDGVPAPAQESMRVCHGSQCGYCTPGFVMALTGALETKTSLDRKSAANCLTGNLCRCTGYSPILDAAESMRASPEHRLTTRYLTSKNIKALRETTKSPLAATMTGGKNFFAPRTLRDACGFLARHKSARVIGAATDIGVQVNKGKTIEENLLSLHHIPELYEVEISKPAIQIGARVDLTTTRSALSRVIPEFSRFLDIFASPQIKNVATMVGNLANASPIGDTLPFLLATDAVISTARVERGKLTRRDIPIANFFLGYKKLALKPAELITSITIPRSQPFANLRLYKSSQRKDLDISAVSAAFNIHTSKNGKVTGAAIALGGIAATPVRLDRVERFLMGKDLSADTIDATTQLLNAEIKPISDPRATDTYRRVLVTNLFQAYAREVFPTTGGSER